MNFVQNEEKILKLNHLPEYFSERLLNEKPSQDYTVSQGALQNVLTEIEKKIISSVLSRNNRNISKAARELGISRQNLHYKLKALGISNSLT